MTARDPWSGGALTGEDAKTLAREDAAPVERATYDSAGARLLREVTERPAAGAQWSPERGWHDV